MAFRLVNKEKLLPPKKCLICERTPNRRVVDTGYNLNKVPQNFFMRGRKYVCEGCVEKVGKATGMVTQERWEEQGAQLATALNENAELNAQLTNLTEYLAAVAKGGLNVLLEDEE